MFPVLCLKLQTSWIHYMANMPCIIIGGWPQSCGLCCLFLSLDPWQSNGRMELAPKNLKSKAVISSAVDLCVAPRNLAPSTGSSSTTMLAWFNMLLLLWMFFINPQSWSSQKINQSLLNQRLLQTRMPAEQDGLVAWLRFDNLGRYWGSWGSFGWLVGVLRG